MKVLIVYAYRHQGLNAPNLARVRLGWQARHEVKTLDLPGAQGRALILPSLRPDHQRRDLDKDPQMAPCRGR